MVELTKTKDLNLNSDNFKFTCNKLFQSFYIELVIGTLRIISTEQGFIVIVSPNSLVD